MSDAPVRNLLVRSADAQVKIEVTPVLRATVFEPVLRAVSPSVEEQFGFAETLLVSFADLYAGKLVAALDRQHPGDLFDVRDLLDNEGIDDALREAFLVYLVSHNRPMFEILAARRKDVRLEYERGFVGMTDGPVSLMELEETFDRLVDHAVRQMPATHRRFLIDFERGQPDWSLLSVREASALPAIAWRQHNLDTLTGQERGALVSNLERVLYDSG